MSVFDAAMQCFKFFGGKSATETRVFERNVVYEFAQDLAKWEARGSGYSLRNAIEGLSKTMHGDMLGPATKGSYLRHFSDGTSRQIPYYEKGKGPGVFSDPEGYGYRAGDAIAELRSNAKGAVERADAVSVEGFSDYAPKYRAIATRAEEIARQGEATLYELRDKALKHTGNHISVIEERVEYLKRMHGEDPGYAGDLETKIEGDLRFLEELKNYRAKIENWGKPDTWG